MDQSVKHCKYINSKLHLGAIVPASSATKPAKRLTESRVCLAKVTCASWKKVEKSWKVEKKLSESNLRPLPKVGKSNFCKLKKVEKGWKVAFAS